MGQLDLSVLGVGQWRIVQQFPPMEKETGNHFTLLRFTKS